MYFQISFELNFGGDEDTSSRQFEKKKHFLKQVVASLTIFVKSCVKYNHNFQPNYKT